MPSLSAAQCNRPEARSEDCMSDGERGERMSQP